MVGAHTTAAARAGSEVTISPEEQAPRPLTPATFLGIGVLRGREFRTTDVADAGKVVYPQVTPYFTGSLVVRAGGDPMALVPAIRQVILAQDPNQPIEDIATLAELGSASVAGVRLNAILLTAFAALALIIAAVGLGGVLAFSVGSRTREFGVRSAIGAARHQIWSGVLAEGARMAAVGIVLGLAGAVVLTRFMAWLLVGVPALDPVTFVAVGVVLAAVTVLAAWAPAWRAARVSPVEAMAAE